MSEWWLIALLLTLMVAACLFAVYPLRKQRGFSVLFALISLALISLGYWQWGGFSDWHTHLAQLEKQKQVSAMMQSANGPQVIIQRLKDKLKQQPNSAKGWYLLGRIYSGQGDWQQAKQVFGKAHQLEPENEQYTVYYAQGLWQLNQQQFNPQIRDVFKELLKKNPKQPDALAMLAMDAFMSHAYEEAISYWQRLLALAPANSEEAQALRKAIAKAQQKLNQGRNDD